MPILVLDTNRHLRTARRRSRGRTLAITQDTALARRASRVVEIHDGRITSDQATNAAA